MNFLVPYDFTSITRTALDHALAMQRTLGGSIELLHVVGKEAQRTQAETQLAEVIESLSPDEKSLVRSKVRVGDIFTDITKQAEEGGFQLLIMGTHGAKGLQKVLGSKAIKVIVSGHTPFVITQGKGPSGNFKCIVVPVDLSKESVQVVKFAANLASQFNAEVHLVCPPEKDEWLVKKVVNNVNYARQELSRKGVKHKVASLPGKHSLEKEVIAYGKEHGADLFAVAHFFETILPQFETFTQRMITNPLQLPVLVINATPVTNINASYSFLTV